MSECANCQGHQPIEQKINFYQNEKSFQNMVLDYNKENNQSNLQNQSMISHQPNITNHNSQSCSRDITTVKAFKFNEKTGHHTKQAQIDQKLQNLQISIPVQQQYQNQAACGSRSTTVKKECANCCSSKIKEHRGSCQGCNCRSKCENLMNVSFTSHNCVNGRRSSIQGKQVNSSYTSTPIINMEQRFSQQQQSNVKYQMWDEYNDNAKIVISCSPLSSLKHSMLDKQSYQVSGQGDLLLQSNLLQQNLQQENSENKLSTIESQLSMSSSAIDKNTLAQPTNSNGRESTYGRNNINISKLTDGNSVLSKHSINSSGVCIEKLINMSNNSQSNFFLRPNGLLEIKHGMLASAELTQGQNSQSYLEDHVRSNSSLPMFSPLKESDLIYSRKITPRTNFPQAQNNINIIRSQEQSSGSFKQSLQLNQLQSAIQNLHPFDLQSQQSFDSQHHQHQPYQTYEEQKLTHSRSMKDEQHLNSSLLQSVPVMNRIVSYNNQSIDPSSGQVTSTNRSLNFTLTESNITQHKDTARIDNQFQQYEKPRSRLDTHRITATFLNIN